MNFKGCHPERSEGPMQLADYVGVASGLHRSSTAGDAARDGGENLSASAEKKSPGSIG